MNDIRKSLETISNLEEGIFDKLLGRAAKSSLKKPQRAEPSMPSDESPNVFRKRNDPNFSTAQQRGEVPKDDTLPTSSDIIAQGQRRLSIKSAEEEAAKKAAAEKSARELQTIQSAAAQKSAMDAERKAAEILDFYKYMPENSGRNAIIKGINEASQPENAEWTGRTQEYKGRVYNIYRNKEVDAAGNPVLDATGKPKYTQSLRGGDRLYYAPAGDESAPFRTTLRRSPGEVIRDVGTRILKPTAGKLALGALGTAAAAPNVASALGGGIIDAVRAVAPGAAQNIANVGSSLWQRTFGTQEPDKPKSETDKPAPAPQKGNQPSPTPRSEPPREFPTRIPPDPQRDRNL